MRYLYTILNSLNNKIYVGQTKYPEKRWKQHKNLSNKKIKLQFIHKAMAKDGINNFIFEIIAICKTQEDSDEIEKCLIKQYNSRDTNFGYNFMPGGYSQERSEETRKRISKSLIGKCKSNSGSFTNGSNGDENPEFKEKRIAALVGRKYSKESKQKMSDGWHDVHINSGMTGKHHSKETRKKMSESQKGKPKHTDESKAKISKANKGIKRSEDFKQLIESRSWKNINGKRIWFEKDGNEVKAK